MQDIRDLVNSGLTVLTAPVMYYLLCDDIVNPSKLSAPKILQFVLIEAVKIVAVHTICFLYFRSLKGKSRERIPQDLPYTFVDKEMFPLSNGKRWKISIITGWFMSYLSAVIVCHLMLILFGAPAFNKWDLTLGFSFALVGWLFFPLTFGLRSSSMLRELLFLSSVESKNVSRTRAKWSVLITILGAWTGAVFIPLDWDKPWQQWPIPCMVTSFVAYVCIHIFYSCQLAYAHFVH